jgi:hypothetical protein
MHVGDKHDYLGMDMHFSNKGVHNVPMLRYLKNVILSFPVLIMGNATTPATNHLFNVRDEWQAKWLEEERTLAFHHTIA